MTKRDLGVAVYAFILAVLAASILLGVMPFTLAFILGLVSSVVIIVYMRLTHIKPDDEED